MWLSTHTRALYGSTKIPSGRPSTSMVLITFRVLAFHIVIGFVVENPWWDLGSTAAPPALILAIVPTDSSVSRLKTVSCPVGPPRGIYKRRLLASAKI